MPLPSVLTAPVLAPAFPKKTPLLNRDLVNYLFDIRTALDNANAQLQQIRALQPVPPM